MRKTHLNLPLFLSFLCTWITIFSNKRYHLYAGIIFSLLSTIHMLKHKKVLQNEFSKERCNLNIFKNFPLPSMKMEFLMQQVTVSHYSPGRIRLYSAALINNSNLASTLQHKLSEIDELEHFSVNTTTGSILLTYLPENIVKNPELKKIEAMVLKKYKRS